MEWQWRMYPCHLPCRSVSFLFPCMSSLPWREVLDSVPQAPLHMPHTYQAPFFGGPVGALEMSSRDEVPESCSALLTLAHPDTLLPPSPPPPTQCALPLGEGGLILLSPYSVTMCWLKESEHPWPL